MDLCTVMDRANVNTSLQMTLGNPLPSDGLVELRLPPAITVRNGSLMIRNSSTSDGTWNITAVANLIAMKRVNASLPIPSGESTGRALFYQGSRAPFLSILRRCAAGDILWPDNQSLGER